MSRGIPPQVVSSAERCSQFSRQRGMRVDRVIYAYRTVRSADGLWHVLTSIQDAGADYSGRTNHLAQHLILNSSEASELARHGNTPAGVMLGTVCSWGAYDGFCGWLEESPHAVSSEPDASWQFWNAYTGSGYCRLNLCSDAALRGAVLIYGMGLEQQTADEAKQVLCLFAESQAGCPDKGWGTTFTTSLEPNDEMADFRWIGVAEDSPMLAKLDAAGGRVKITFDTPAPVARQPSSAAAPLSPSAPAAASDPLGNPHKDSSPAIDGPAPIGGGKPPRIPPKRPVPAPKEEPFLKRHRSKLEGAAIALVVLATAGFLLRSLLSEKPITFQEPLVFPYDSLPKVATPAVPQAGATVVYQNPRMGPDFWTSQAPVDAGSYRLGLEVPKWFGFNRTIVASPHTMVIEQKKPKVVFPEDLNFVRTNATQVVSLDEKIKIVPATAAQDFALEYRRIEPNPDAWDPRPRAKDGKYEVKVSTRETRNFAQVVAVTNFTITSAASNSGASTTKTNFLAEFPGIRPKAPDQSGASVVPSTQRVSSAYYLAFGPDALRLANEASAWRENPNEIEVRQWGDDLPNYRSIKGGRLSPMSDDFAMTSGGLPESRKSTSEIKENELVFRASYATDPQQVFVIGLKLNGSSEGAVRDLLPGKAWLRHRTSSLLELASANEFFKNAKLLPSGSKWILVYEDQPYSEGEGALRLESDTAEFDVKSRIDAADLDRETAADKLRLLAEQAKNPPAGDNYFDQNRPTILRPLEELSDKSPLAKSLAGQIKSLPKPNVDVNDASSSATLASALLLGALKIAHNDPEIQARIKLSSADQNKLDGQLNKARSDRGGWDYSKIKDENLLPPDELGSWLINRGERPPSIRDVRSAAVSWLGWRLANLQEPPNDAPTLSDPVKEVLSKLRQGLEACIDQSAANAPKDDPKLMQDSLAKQIQAAEEKARFLTSWGNPGASGHARLEIRLGQSEPVTLLPMVFLGPPMDAVK